ncbi:MAG: DUF4340 domain-containing protein [Chloroflexia bacterium]
MERYRTTIILVAVLLVLAGVAYLLNNKPGTGSGEGVGTPTVDASKYVWQESSAVDSIDVISGTKHVSLRKDITSTIWSLIAPIQGDADAYSVDSEATALQNLQALTVLTSATDLSQYSLDKPAMQVLIRAGGDKPTKHTLLVGTTTIDGAGYYVKESDKAPVYVVSNTTIEPLRSWLDTPPKAQPTATPLPITVVPPTATKSITATGTLTVTLPISGTPTSPATSPITSTGPGAANPTTPVASPTSGQ